MKCTNCQTECSANAKFCSNCENTLHNSPAGNTTCTVTSKKKHSYQARLVELADSARYQDLLRFCKEEIAKNPNNEDIFTNLAELITSEKITNAQNFLEGLQKSFPENTHIKLLFVALFITQEDWKNAWGITEALMPHIDKLNKENQATLHYSRFFILANMTDQPESPDQEIKQVERLRNFLSKEDQIIFDYYKGLFLISKEKFQEAFDVAEHLLRNNPDDLNLLYLHALASLNSDKDGWISDLETIWNSPNATEELKENIKKLLDNTILLDNAFIMNYHKEFYQDVIAFLTEYREAKEMSDFVGLFSVPKIACLLQGSVNNAFRCLRQATQEIHTDEMKKELLDMEKGIIQEVQQNIKPFLDDLPHLKKKMLEQGRHSEISNFMSRGAKESNFGCLDVEDSFMEKNKKDKSQAQVIQKWNNQVQEIAKIMDKAWKDCLKTLSDLSEKYPLLCLWESNVLDKLYLNIPAEIRTYFLS